MTTHVSVCEKFSIVALFIIVVQLSGNYGTNRYYFAYLPYGSGDNIITTWRYEGGSLSLHRKWNVECLDGEAVVGIQDFVDDFQKIYAIWCRFMFPYKPPSEGKYPYYPSCIYRDYRFQFFCFDRQNISLTINTFMTAIWDNEYQFWVGRIGSTVSINNDFQQPYKCCKTPKGYYIDYVSCYYVPTHDPNWEYYDSQSNFIVSCGTDYVMTGIAKKISPVGLDWQIDWVQCCRLGYGAATAVSPPIITLPDGRSTFYAASHSTPIPKPVSYASNQLLSRSTHETSSINITQLPGRKVDDIGSMRYKRRSGIPMELRDHGHLGDHLENDGRNIVLRQEIRYLS
ncbi:uncharacterized protein LOC129585135 [Paramacrobiotus metropolitanus]|uniref:uncharacterized protein LOC129585135 n=1 Tax=Paramacrobiotus metropolitanus TaxID=2943436 RepID=UPI0024464AD1|nr:uncharacterized protein LOC129585135 [Paramacrobiotus metropolitanus]